MMMLINRSNLARTQMNVFLPSSRFKKVLSLLLSQKKAVLAAAGAERDGLGAGAADLNAPVSIERSIDRTQQVFQRDTHKDTTMNWKILSVELQFLFY